MDFAGRTARRCPGPGIAAFLAHDHPLDQAGFDGAPRRQALPHRRALPTRRAVADRSPLVVEPKRVRIGFVMDEHRHADIEVGDPPVLLAERQQGRDGRHPLRGNAGTLGALDLMASATALEQAIDRGEMELDERLTACDRQIADLIEASRPWREPAEAPGPASGEAPPLEAHQLKALREDLRLHNMKALRRFKELQPALRGCEKTTLFRKTATSRRSG